MILESLLFLGIEYLEAFAEADTIVFDKTGTLTAACPRVEEVLDFTGKGADEMLRVAACIEEHFPHSMARAVTRAAQEKGLYHEEEHAAVEYVVAHGVATALHGQRALIGSHHFIFEDEGVTCTQDQLQQIGLGVPATVQLSQMLRSRGLDVPEGILSLQEMAQWIQTQSKEAGHV